VLLRNARPFPAPSCKRRMKLSARAIDGLKADPARPLEVSDDQTQGSNLRISPSGVKFWMRGTPCGRIARQAIAAKGVQLTS
jgi:hypothetical protein